jgi:hypothetical protein
MADVSLIISILSLVVSVLTTIGRLFFTSQASKRRSVQARSPILLFTYKSKGDGAPTGVDGIQQQQGTWIVKNAGYGAAFNIVVETHLPNEQDTLTRLFGSRCYTSLPPMAKDDCFDLSWVFTMGVDHNTKQYFERPIQHNNFVVRATYTSFAGEKYESTYTNESAKYTFQQLKRTWSQWFKNMCTFPKDDTTQKDIWSLYTRERAVQMARAKLQAAELQARSPSNSGAAAQP